MVRGDEGGWCADRGLGAGIWDGVCIFTGDPRAR